MVFNGTGGLSGASFLGYFAIASQIVPPIKQLTIAYNSIQKGMASEERINKILDAENTIVNVPNPTPIKSFSTAIKFNNVSFSYKKGEVYKITYVNKTINPSVISVDALDKKVKMYTEFSSQIPECEWVGMQKPSYYEEQQEKAQQQWSSWGTNNHLGYLTSEQILNLHNEPITIKKSKVQQVEVVPLQKPCIISTKKSKFKLQIN